MEFSEYSDTNPMNSLIEDLEARTEYVITLLRDSDSDMDADPGRGAFAFVLGRDSDNAIVVEGTVAGDRSESVVTIWAVRDGARVDISTIEIDGQILHSLKLV